MSDSSPTLWHIAISHYSEKARWALDYKEVPHTRRAVSVPGLHIPAAKLLTRGASSTFPVLEIDGQRIGDSTEIIAVLEGTFPEPPLYPADPVQRRRALELEDFFDEELGPHIRLLAFHELGKDPERFEAVIARTAPASVARLGSGAVMYARTYTGLRFGVRDEAAAALARQGNRRPRSARGRARLGRVPGRRLLQRRRPDRRLDVLPPGAPRRGAGAHRRTAAGRDRELPRPAAGAPRLQVGRSDVPPPPPQGWRARGRCVPGLSSGVDYPILGG
jgi:glutathione S-transferase